MQINIEVFNIPVNHFDENRICYKGVSHVSKNSDILHILFWFAWQQTEVLDQVLSTY